MSNDVYRADSDPTVGQDLPEHTFSNSPELREASFNGRMRDELLNETLFRNIPHARDLIAAWVTGYNTERPHSALGYQTPSGFALHLTTAIAHPAARDESSAHRAIAQPAPISVNVHSAPVMPGWKISGRSPTVNHSI